MKLQEVLNYMGWDKLPKAEKSSGNKCPVLVKRTTGEQDYAISNNFHIVADINFKASIVSVIEYYPMHREKPVEVEAKVTEPVEEKTKREKMIDFLLFHKNKLEVINKKKDKDLVLLCKIYGGDFD